MISFVILFPSRQFLITSKYFKSYRGLNCLVNLHLFSTSPSFRFQILSLQPPVPNLTTARPNTCPSKLRGDKTHSEFWEHIHSRVFLMAHFIFFGSSITTLVPLSLPCITCLISLFTMFRDKNRVQKTKTVVEFIFFLMSLAYDIQVY